MANDTKKAAFIVGGILIGVVVLFAFKAVAGKTNESSTAVLRAGGAQEVTLTLGAIGYEPDPIRVKAGIPVRITVDLGSVKGCTASVVMPSFGVRKRAVPGDNVIEFTPDKPGTYPFSCSMGMSQGIIVVE